MLKINVGGLNQNEKMSDIQLMKLLHRLDKAPKSAYNSLYSNKGDKRRREEVAGSKAQTESSRLVKGAWDGVVNTSRSFALNGGIPVGCNGVGARYSTGVMMVTSRAVWT